MKSQKVIGVEVAIRFEWPGNLSSRCVHEQVCVRITDDDEGKNAIHAPHGVDVVAGNIGTICSLFCISLKIIKLVSMLTL